MFSKKLCVLFIILIIFQISTAWNDLDVLRPKLVSTDGNLDIVGALNRNITLKTSGSGCININGENLLQITSMAYNASLTINKLKSSYLDRIDADIKRLSSIIDGPDGLKYKVDNFENASTNTFPNTISPIMINRRMLSLRRRMNKIETDLSELTSSLTHDNCASNPCRNGGRCQDLFNNFLCWCPPNWEGAQCDIDVNECSKYVGTDLGCQNGATCLNKMGSYTCICPAGWYGIHCTRKTDNCDSASSHELCGHGVCVSQRNTHGFTCICDPGWKTDGVHPACTVDIDECSGDHPHCSVSPPVKCINVPGSYYCGTCPIGYTGTGFYCTDLDECLQNNGGCSTLPQVQCINTIGSSTCGPCPPGYQGDGRTCTQSNVGICAVNNGGCSKLASCVALTKIGPTSVQCICPNNYIGDGIGENGCVLKQTAINSTIGPCSSIPCGKNGNCRIKNNNYECVCTDHFTGRNCDTLDMCSILNNPCQNGGSCRNTNDGWECDCDSIYFGKRCEVEKEACGGYISQRNGTIRYPSNRTIYDSNISCAWTIVTSPDYVLNITFSNFDLEKGTGTICSHDWVQIHDGKNSAAHNIGRFCGTDLPKGGNFISTSNMLYLWFHSNAYINKGGFTISWTSQVPHCFEKFLAPTHGTIRSPGSPGKYPPNRDCHYLILVPYQKRIQFHFYIMVLGPNPDCNSDYLEIFDGSSSDDPLLAKYCQTSHPVPLVTSGSEAYLHFHSDKTGNYDGFQITFSVEPGIPGCGGTYTKYSGELSAPMVNGQYQKNLACEYLIKVSNGTRVKLTYLEMDLEESDYACNFDYIEVREGDDPLPKNKDLVAKYCGKTLPPTWISTSNEVYIKFRSDFTHNGKGFRIQYSTVCGETFTTTSGIIVSPNYPDDSKSKKTCAYKISVPLSSAIKLQFKEFEMGSSRKCDKLGLSVYDGDDKNAVEIGNYCGSKLSVPYSITSTHNHLYIEYRNEVSSLIFSKIHFILNYTTIDLGCGGILRESIGIVKSPTDTAQYPLNKKCKWLIIAPPGYIIQLTWVNFDLEQSYNCTADYVSVYDETLVPGQSKPLGKYCGKKLPPFIVSTSNVLSIEFKSDMSKADDGFILNYVMRDESNVCGRPFFASSGTLSSPGYPDGYQRNKDCVWTITVPSGQQITLNVNDFNIEQHLNCKFDFLEIRMGGYETSPLVGKFCGTNIPKLMTSHSNEMYIRFKSDASRGGKGFRISWDASTTGCGGSLSSWNGYIISPNYPKSYGRSTECFWKIITSAGSVIQLVFIDIDLESSVFCRLDYVEIHNGLRLSNSPIGRYCSAGNIPATILSKSNELFIKFRSDLSFEGRGFKLQYSTVCNNTIKGHQGVVESPNYPNEYPNFLDCVWKISVPNGNKINITFTHFDLEKEIMGKSKCRNIDYVEIKETDNSEQNEVEIPDSTRFCGSELPEPITTSFNNIFIHFKSDSISVGNGFRLEWVIHGCGGIITRPIGTITSPNYPKHYPINTVCEWLIQTDFDSSIELTIRDLEIERIYTCDFDNLAIYNGQDDTAPVLNRLCATIKSDIVLTSSGNSMFLRFTSDGSFQGKGFNATYKKVPIRCGGKLTASEGTITSRNYPKNYDSKDDCYWIIEVPKTFLIKLTFDDFDIEKSRNCTSDFLNVYDGNTTETPLLLSHCGNMLPEPVTYVSSNNVMLIHMSTDGLFTSKGFRANYSIQCGAHIITESTGVIDFSEQTMNADNCTWTIETSIPGEHVSLTITHLNLENNIYDYDGVNQTLYVYNGLDSNSPLIGSYYNRKIPPTIISEGSALHLVMELSSDTSVVFTAAYSALSTACGGELTSVEGEFASIGYPKNYPTDVDCVWKIQPAAGNTVFLTFPTFDLEESENCNNDYVELREGLQTGKLIKALCGHYVLSSPIKAPSLWIRFRTDSEGTAKGFLANYNIVFGNDNITGTEGRIQSPFYPKYYRDAETITWTINVKIGNVILITFDEFNFNAWDNSDDCDDYYSLDIYDGSDEDAPILLKACTNSSPSPVITSGTTVFIKFRTMDHWKGSLFNLKWNAVNRRLRGNYVKPAKVNNCGSDEVVNLDLVQEYTLQSPGYPDGYGNSLTCTWTFITGQNNHVALTFLAMDLEVQMNCISDSVTIYSSSTGSKNEPVTVGKYCLSNSTTISAIEAQNMMKVEFKTNSYFNKTGFKAKLFSACGGQINGQNGIIDLDMAAYVKNHSNHQLPADILYNCNWNVSVRAGRRIKVNFEKFEKNRTLPGCNNYVMLKNGLANDSPLLGIGKYCTSEKALQEIPTTSGNTLSIRYRGFARYEVVHFRLRYTEASQSCGGTILLTNWYNSTNISSPNYPEIPHPYTECEWIIRAPPGEAISINFLERIDVTYSSDCSKAGVELRDGASIRSPLILVHCKYRIPSTKFTSGNSLYVRFYTNVPEPKNGFKAEISIATCGGTIHPTENYTLTSPNYPILGSLIKNLRCTWKIITPSHRGITITFNDLNLPGNSNCSKVAHLEFTETDLETYHLGTFCGSSNKNQTITSFSDHLMVTFDSMDFSLTYFKGFSFNITPTYFKDCGGKLSGSEGVFTSPNYGLSKRRSQICSWEITAPVGRRIKLQILDFEKVGKRTSATDVGLAFFNRLRENTLRLLKSDNYEPNITIESSRNYLYLYYWSFTSDPHGGFKAQWSSNEPTICVGSLNENSGTIYEPIHHNSLYKKFTIYYCEWERKSNNLEPETLAITMQKLELPPSTLSKCEYATNFVKIFDETGGPNNPLKTYCTVLNQPEIVRSPYKITTLAVSQGYFGVTSPHLNYTIHYQVYKCGGIISSAQTIDIHGDQNIPFDKSECVWSIKLAEGSRIRITFLSINLDSNCTNEYIGIKNGNHHNSPEIGIYCGNKKPNVILSQSNKLWVEFHSNIPGKRSRPGFQLQLEDIADGCGGVYNEKEMIIKSPNYPKSYPANSDCTWVAKVPEGNSIGLISTDSFQIEETKNCVNDFIEVWDYTEGNWNSFGRSCGRTFRTYNSTSNQMKIRFKSNNKTQGTGFQLKWNTNCGGIFEVTSKLQTIVSPGYPVGYDNQRTCNYTLISKSGKEINLEFTDFLLESGSNCKFDNVTIYSKRWLLSSFKKDWGTYCSDRKPPQLNLRSYVEIIFQTDYWITKRGFAFQFSTTNCGSIITSPTTISSPKDKDRVNRYAHDMHCYWNITAPPDRLIMLRFQRFELEYSSKCRFDYLAIYDGNTEIDSKRMHKLCGSLVVPIIRSTQNHMLIHFRSDSSSSLSGFEAEILFKDGPNQGCGGTIELTTNKTSTTFTLNDALKNKDGMYRPYLDCQWLLKAPKGYILKIEFTSVHISICPIIVDVVVNRTLNDSNTKTCTCDFLQLYDGMSDLADTIMTHCGHTIPKSVLSSTQYVALRFVSDGDTSSTGFVMNVNIEPSICGESILFVTNTTKTLTSPNYPDNYPPNVRCIWYLVSDEPYTRFDIHFEKLDIQGPNLEGQCTNDRIEILDKDDNHVAITEGTGSRVFNGVPIGFSFMRNLRQFGGRLPISSYTLCNSGTPMDYYSGTKTVAIKFISDATIQKTGFKINYRQVGCNRNFTGEQGRIYIYKVTNTNCIITITTEKNRTVSLYFQSFFIFDSGNCNRSGVSIFDGLNQTSKELLHMCGLRNPNSITSSGNSLMIKIWNMHTLNHINTLDIIYTTTDAGPGCGGKIFNYGGKFTSPNYPSIYNKTGICVWEVSTPPGTSITVQFLDMKLGTRETCATDYLEIFSRSPSGWDDLFGKYCGGDSLRRDIYFATNTIIVKYTTSKNNAGLGWQARFFA